jgi:hypothetical protein
MNTESTNKKTTCNKKSVTVVLPEPPIEVIAGITGLSESYVSKIGAGTRKANSKKAKLAIYCKELIVDSQKILIEAVTEAIEQIKTT